MPYKKNYRGRKNRGYRKGKRKRKTTTNRRTRRLRPVSYSQNKAAQNYHRMLLNNSIYGKLFKSIMTHYRFGISDCNKESQSAGANTLNNSSTHLPLHIYALNNIHQGDVQQYISHKLQDDFNTFTNLHYVEKFAIDGQGNQDKQDTVWHNTLLQRYINLKLMLWQATATNAVYKLNIFKLDWTLDPYTDVADLTAEQTETRKTFYAEYLLKDLVTSPILSTTGTKSKIKGLYKNLWSKTIVIKEQSSDNQDHAFKQVSLFRYTNNLIDYNTGKRLEDNGGNAYSNADLNSAIQNAQLGTMNSESTAGTNTGIPQLPKRVYLIITSNVPLNGTGNTYDIHYISKYSSVSQ